MSSTHNVVQKNARREHGAVGVRVEAPVLVPLDGRAGARGLEVQLDVVVPEARADHLRDGAAQRLVAHEPAEGVRVLVRRADALDERRVGGLEREAPDPVLHHGVHDGLQLRDRLPVDELGEKRVAELLVLPELLVGHPHGRLEVRGHRGELRQAALRHEVRGHGRRRLR